MQQTFFVVAAALLGLQTGALLTEALVLVPRWRSQPAAEFHRWYRENAATLLHFFGPLEVLATVATMAAAAAGWWHGAGAGRWGLASVFALAVVAEFPVYFQKANARFERGDLAPEALAAELGRWAAWHWSRVALSGGAFLLALTAL